MKISEDKLTVHKFASLEPDLSPSDGHFITFTDVYRWMILHYEEGRNLLLIITWLKNIYKDFFS
jgi:hypothetical protein